MLDLHIVIYLTRYVLKVFQKRGYDGVSLIDPNWSFDNGPPLRLILVDSIIISQSLPIIFKYVIFRHGKSLQVCRTLALHSAIVN